MATPPLDYQIKKFSHFDNSIMLGCVDSGYARVLEAVFYLPDKMKQNNLRNEPEASDGDSLDLHHCCCYIDTYFNLCQYSNMDSLREYLNENYVISLTELLELVGHKTGVYRLVESGVISKVYPNGLGFFCLPETEEGTAHFAIVKKYYPNCIISGKTALSLYDLGLDYYEKLDVDIPKGQNLRNKLLNVHRVVEKKIIGVEQRKFDNKGIPFKINIYGPERTLFEAYKYYKGLDSYFYALKQYKKLFLKLDSPGDQFEKILSFNKKSGREMIDLLEMGS